MPLIADTLTNTNFFRGLFGMATNATFDEQAANIYISRDANVGIIGLYHSPHVVCASELNELINRGIYWDEWIY